MRETSLWTWHMMAGVVILVFLGLHMIIMHLDRIFGFFNPFEGAAIEWQNVLHRSQQGFFFLTYIILLGAALYHGLYGLRSMLLELNFCSCVQKLINRVCLFAGIILFIIGTAAAFVVKFAGA